MRVSSRTSAVLGVTLGSALAAAIYFAAYTGADQPFGTEFDMSQLECGTGEVPSSTHSDFATVFYKTPKEALAAYVGEVYPPTRPASAFSQSFSNASRAQYVFKASGRKKALVDIDHSDGGWSVSNSSECTQISP